MLSSIFTLRGVGEGLKDWELQLGLGFHDLVVKVDGVVRKGMNQTEGCW